MENTIITTVVLDVDIWEKVKWVSMRKRVKLWRIVNEALKEKYQHIVIGSDIDAQ